MDLRALVGGYFQARRPQREREEEHDVLAQFLRALAARLNPARRARRRGVAERLRWAQRGLRAWVELTSRHRLRDREEGAEPGAGELARFLEQLIEIDSPEVWNLYFPDLPRCFRCDVRPVLNTARGLCEVCSQEIDAL